MQSSNQVPKLRSPWAFVRRINARSAPWSTVGAYHASNGSSCNSAPSSTMVISDLFANSFETMHGRGSLLDHVFQTTGRIFGDSRGVVVLIVGRRLGQVVRRAVGQVEHGDRRSRKLYAQGDLVAAVGLASGRYHVGVAHPPNGDEEYANGLCTQSIPDGA